ncbi:MAG: SUMF1/EgtB/PvdO family nonheme iron enzyme [Sandaracinaceae bacterium]|nr:SUMF1/EgtB/PvdO family nonheme iron enzyme [Sandaracinaceae bacterium]
MGMMLAACGGGDGMRDAGADMGTDAGTEPVDGGGDDAGADAGPECTPNEMRNVDCGNCGLAQQICSAEGMWLAPGECLAEGECAVAAVETENTDRCGTRTRICDDTCHWRDWTVMVPDGECVANGTVREASATCTVSEVLERHCSDACVLDAGTCVDACGGTRRTTPADAEEVCIPAGPFIRGTDAFADTQPVAEVQMSAYYIDRYPVTNDRYRDCVNAGVCTAPRGTPGVSSDIGATSYADPTRGRFPVQELNYVDATTFCSWDGGRIVPSEAEWEKAARGPSPSALAFPWGNAFVCSYVRCNDFLLYTMPRAVGSLPASQSYYGLEEQIGAGFEWTRDLYNSGFYSRPESLTDPVSTTGTVRALRGQISGSGSTQSQYHLSRRQASRSLDDQPLPSIANTFRCARPAPGG